VPVLTGLALITAAFTFLLDMILFMGVLFIYFFEKFL